MTTQALLRQVWGRRGSDDNDRVRTVVKKLRAKLGDDAANPAYVVTQHGVGYRIADPGDASGSCLCSVRSFGRSWRAWEWPSDARR